MIHLQDLFEEKTVEIGDLHTKKDMLLQEKEALQRDLEEAKKNFTVSTEELSAKFQQSILALEEKNANLETEVSQFC